MAQKSPQAREESDYDLVIKDFKGVNTQAARTAIAQDEFAWLENVMPVGYANLRAVPFQGAPVGTIAAVTINYMQYINLANIDYQICATSGGAAYAVNLATYAVTTIGVGGTFTTPVRVTQWSNTECLIIAANGYWSWNVGSGLVSLGGTTGAPSAGQTIATFSGRVWIGNGRTVSFSAPASYTDFTTASYGGSFIMTDETMTSNIVSLKTANNFLYITGDSSVNVISDVQVTSGTGAATVFSNTNISSQIGSTFDNSIFSYYRTIGFATTYGFYAMYGTTPQKASDDLDGIFPLIDFTKPVSGGVANIYNILCMCFCFTYNDPAGARPLLALFFNKKWFFASQGASLTLIADGFQSGTPALFGTDGTNIYKLFSDTTSSISTKIETALWPLGYPTRMKEAQKAGVEMTTAPVTTTFNLTLDSDFAIVATTLSSTNIGEWINNALVVGQWINALSVSGDWITSAFQIFQGDAEFKGRYLGYTLTSTSPQYELNGLLMSYQLSTPWATRAN